jgi:hypothetical protein
MRAKMNRRPGILTFALVLAGSLVASAEVKITVEHNNNDNAEPGFKFQNVTPPARKNAATNAKFIVVNGELDPASGGLDKLNDGRLPDEEDQPDENFFFRAGTAGGRLVMDLGSVIDMKQIKTYSWHPAARGPQVYELYVSDGALKNFNAAPTNGINPESCGWRQIASVNTRANNGGDDGGQYGVGISDTGGVIGKYRYLLFDMASTERDDAFGNTFYSEINVLDTNAPDEKVNAATDAPKSIRLKTVDGKCEITINTSAAPELKSWAENELAPVLAQWYPKIAALLSSEGFTPPEHFSVTLKPVKGVAFTSGTRVVANSAWLGKELQGQAIGSLVHEMAHVVQQFKGHNPAWLVEGSADYIRWFKYEPQSHGADVVWMQTMRHFSPHYNDSYRVTANFLNWITQKYDSEIVEQMNAAMREGKYDDGLWKKYTGKTAPELGEEWKKDVEAQLAGAQVPDKAN